jgi:hypothetical protein
MEMTYEKAIKMGGKEWKGGDHHRVYFNGEAKRDLYGLEVGYYKTGNVSWATRNGERISNTKARRYLNSNPYYDVNKKEMCGMIE